MRNIIKIYLFFLGIFSINAQEVLPITKEEILNKTLKNNFNLKISKENFNKAKAHYYKTRSVFLPNINASYTGFVTTNPLMAFGSKLNQGILTQNDFNPDLLNNPSQTRNFATKIEIKQPLINLNANYQRKAAEFKMQASKLNGKRISDYLWLEVSKTYMQLQLAYKSLEVLESSKKTVLENKVITINKYNQGLLLKTDKLSVDIKVLEINNQLQIAKSTIKNISNYLSFLMNENSDVTYKPKEKFIVENKNFSNTKLSKNRSDLKAMLLKTNANKALYKANKTSFLPNLNAFGSYEIYDNKAFQGGASGYIIGAQLSWNIFKGNKRIGETLNSKAELEKSKLEFKQYFSKNLLELKKTKRQLTDAKNKIELAALGVKQSRELLNIKKNRLNEGLEKIADFLAAETVYVQKQLDYYQTIFKYNYTAKYIEFLTKE